MSRPPVFGHEGGRWTLGSQVRVHWWAPAPEAAAFPRLPAVEEQHANGVVAAITQGGPEGWTIEVTLGPLLDLARPPGMPLAFNPSQVRALGCSEESGLA